jgi:hypothetical protein
MVFKNKDDLKAGDHFWALIDEQLVMMMMDKEGKHYVCGGWECEINPDDFDIIELIKFPIGYSEESLYYK